MALTQFGKNSAYDAAARPAAWPLGGLLGFAKDSIQGACSGLLALLGATHLTNAPAGFADLHSSVPLLDGVWESISAGGMAGPVEMLGGVALFLAARRAIARTCGLLLFIGFVFAYVQGYTLSDILLALSGAIGDAAGALERAAAAQSA